MEFKPISKKRPFEKNGAKPKNRHRKRDEEEYDDPDESKPRENSNSGNKKLIFDDEGNTVAAGSKAGKAAYAARHQQQRGTDVDTKWFQVHDAQNTHGELVEMKEAELTELTNTCRTCFESELASLQKQNPSDAKWLQTALHKGTSKDRANAGALLVQSNPLANLAALETLITLAKVSNKTSAGAVDIITELFISALLPPSRKLLTLQLRGADWKALRKDEDLEKATRDRVLAYWHFEQELKEHYFEFLRNVQAAIQGNQDVQKNQAIICSARLLTFSPEKEQMLLSMLVNKLGDPSNKVASKALHHLSEVAYKHPAMCEVITKETEKLLFRNNITEHAQHFALCFLSTVAPRGNAAVCTRLVQICFSFFKVVVQKGAVNSKTMQAILRCLKRAIVDASTERVSTDGGDLLTKEIQDTMYRLVHLADIHITLQTLALLLQVMTVRSGNYDRYYNALYRKMLDINLVNVGPKAAAQFLHIVHRAIHMDANVPRAQAFVKRLLQVAFYFPAQITCGVLIVVNKLLKSRPEIGRCLPRPDVEVTAVSEVLEKDGDAEAHSKDVQEAVAEVTLDEDKEVEVGDEKEGEDDDEKEGEDDDEKEGEDGEKAEENTTTEEKSKKVDHVSTTKYSPYNRNPAFAGAEYALKTELLQLAKHFHPTVQVFAQNLIASKPINFYGDPLRDFCLTQFLERFSFRNPKKLEDKKANAASLVHTMHHKNYQAHGGRGQPVQNLTRSNCTEDERFIFQYLEQKREKRVAIRKALGKRGDGAVDDDVDSDGSVDDDEFEEYLDGLGGKGGKGEEDGEEDEMFDFMGDLGDELKGGDEKKDKLSKRAQKRAAEDDEVANGDWDEDGDDENDDEGLGGGDDDDDDELGSDDGSVSLDGEDIDDEDGSDIFEASDDDDDNSGPEMDGDDDDDDEDDEEDDDEPKSKKSKRSLSDSAFNRKLKNTEDMSSLFAAADDFSEMLQETGKSKTHGTLGDLFNKDKSSEKQMAWEQKRFKEIGGGGSGGNRFAKGKHYGGNKYKGNKNLGRGGGKQKKRK